MKANLWLVLAIILVLAGCAAPPEGALPTTSETSPPPLASQTPLPTSEPTLTASPLPPTDVPDVQPPDVSIPSDWQAYQSDAASLTFALPPAWACIDYDPADKTASLDALLERLADPLAASVLEPYYQPSPLEIFAFTCYRDPDLQTHFLDLAGTNLAVLRIPMEGYAPEGLDASLPDLAGCENLRTFVEDGYRVGGQPAASGLCAAETPASREFRLVFLAGDFLYYFTFESPQMDLLQPEFDDVLETLALLD